MSAPASVAQASTALSPLSARAPILSTQIYVSTDPHNQCDLACWHYQRVVLVVRPGGHTGKIVFRDEKLRFIHTPSDFGSAKVIYLTNDHEPGEIEGDTIFDQEIKVMAMAGATTNRLQFNYVSGGSYIFRDVYSMVHWSGNLEQMKVADAQVI